MKHFLENSRRWWDPKIKDEDVHGHIFPLVDHLKREQDYIKTDAVDHLNMYANRDYSVDQDWELKLSGAEDHIGSNPIRSAIDTIVGRVSSSQPRTYMLTEGGRWEQRRKARKLQKAIDGIKHEGEYILQATRALKDAAIFGCGFIKTYFKEGRIKYERVFPLQLLVDEQSAAHCEPKSIYQCMRLPIEELVDAFPEKQGEILAAQLTKANMGTGGAITSMVSVVEAWHIGCGDTPGRHCIVIDNCTLLCEEWKHDFFPFDKILWNELPAGWYGSGAVEETRGAQAEHNYMLRRIQHAIHNTASKYLVRHVSDTTSEQQFTNQDDTIVEWSGQYEPKVVVNQMIDPQFLEHCWRLRELVFEDVGVSQLTASSKKPKGIESGAALQHLTDTESQRHVHVHRAWERLDLDTTKKTIALLKSKMSGGKSEYKVKYEGGRFLESIDWSEVNISADEYTLKMFPTNLLPTQPAAKVEKVMQWIQSGVIDTLTGQMLIDFPDTDEAGSLLQASIESILWTVDQVVYEDNYIEPKEWYDLENGIRFMQMALSRAEMEGAPQDVLDEGTRWIVEAKGLMNPPAPLPSEMDPNAMQPPIDPMTGMPIDPMAMGGAPMPGMEGLPPPLPQGGPAANLGSPPPAGTIVPGM